MESWTRSPQAGGSARARDRLIHAPRAALLAAAASYSNDSLSSLPAQPSATGDPSPHHYYHAHTPTTTTVTCCEPAALPAQPAPPGQSLPPRALARLPQRVGNPPSALPIAAHGSTTARITSLAHRARCLRPCLTSVIGPRPLKLQTTLWRSSARNPPCRRTLHFCLYRPQTSPRLLSAARPPRYRPISHTLVSRHWERESRLTGQAATARGGAHTAATLVDHQAPDISVSPAAAPRKASLWNRLAHRANELSASSPSTVAGKTGFSLFVQASQHLVASSRLRLFEQQRWRPPRSATR
ncbi:hypothetical protein K491DRAFT_371431 [Lophiostoma macrostomum CBS 122681]|uniref:Uncharacterized protein n=1 Tax=Lophiostoma macrostomum CBS 122681 TaxID=1314788 RepID=A0A6A6TC80_9PLEO|nr:hypothetical protein K491DRAFT_371431 [Lophiostoma macrostomum CBS 122681]